MHIFNRVGVKIGDRVEVEVLRRDKDVVHIKQHRAAAAPHDFAQKLRLGIGALRESEVGGGVFEQHLPPQCVLHLINVITNMGEGLRRIGQRQQIIHEFRAMGGPCEVFGERGGLYVITKPRKPRQMRGVERALPANREANAMDRDGKTL